ncbi:PREDICTED: uncharacterized protein CFAP54, partial [Nestor notabilis]|uniref:uncharacterized protein CFAP54 n=1 Tax=Nestor notabilis TaxID=176057 RepID=UPI0005232524
LPRPRTTTKQLLTEMFDGVAAQFLAILEALSDSSRGVCHPAPPVPDEIEIREVIAELFFAGLEILSGGVTGTGVQGNNFGIINASSTLLQLILRGKLALNFRRILYLAQDDPTWKKAEMELKLLTLMQSLRFPRKFKHDFSISESNTKEAKMPDGSENKQTFTRKRSASLLQDETCDMPEILMKSSTEQLQIAYEILEKAIDGMNTSHLMTLLPDGKSVFDICCTKGDSNDQNLNSVLGCANDNTGTGSSFVMDLHLELLQAQHRVAVKLLKMAQDAQKDVGNRKSSKFHVKDIKDFHYLTEELVIGKIKKNKLSRAIFLMQKAVQKFPKELTTSSQRQLLEKALTLIEQVEAERSALYHSLKEAMSSEKKSKTPPPPLLLSRSHCSMTFKPAPFSSDIQVSWYSIFGSVAGGSNAKVRLNNDKLQNAGEQIPADGKSLLEIQGLEPNEKYIFAVAAYSSDGKLIGDAIGEMTMPILAYQPLSVTTVRAYLTQVAYQTGNFSLAREAFSPMWDYFVSHSSPPPANAAVISASSNLTVAENRLRFEAVSQSSLITLKLFLRSIFVFCDINVMERALFCDSICSHEILYKEQVARLAECERMTVAIELSSWLNDASYTLQSVVQCYGLLAPIIYHKISSVPVVQILIKCLAVLQEIPSATLQRTQAGCYESIQHMIACTSFYTAKIKFMIQIPNLLSVIRRNMATVGFLSQVQRHTRVIKFRSNPRFLEFFVQVLHKILNEEKFQCVLEWAEDVQVYLKRRNDQLLSINGISKQGKSSPKGTKKPEASTLKKSGKKALSPTQKGETLRQYFMKHPSIEKSPEAQRKCKEELQKVARHTLVVLLKPIVSNYIEKRKFRHMCLEEMPWRSQMNIYVAVAHYSLFKKNLEEQYNIGICGSQHLDSYSILDPEIFSLNNSGTVVVREAIENTITPTPPAIIESGMTKEQTCRDKSFKPSIKRSGTNTPQTQTTNDTETSISYSPRECNQFLTNTILLEHFTKIFLHLKKAVIVDPEGDFCIPSCLGGIMDENGGSNLHPQSPLDDVNVVDLKWICNLILKTIELLYKTKKWEALVHIAVQFNIFTQAAFKYWCQALDETLNIADALSNWQELCFPKNATDCFAVGRLTDISQKFLSQAGIWGCLHAAVIVAKIAQYIATSKISLRTKYCYFSAILFKTLFRASLPHPTSDCDFAQYETNMLIPGIDLFSDRYRADISTVVASLNFLMFELYCAKQNLIILPLFTLYQYIVSEICKDPVKSIEGRIFKIKVLTDIGFFTEAFHELSLLNCGERIPWKIPAGYRIIEQMMALQKFDSSESLLTVTNLQVLEDIFNRSLSLTMVPLCNQQIMNKLTLAKMHFIICLSATINNIPEKVEKHIYSADINKLQEPSKITASKGDAGKNSDKNSRQQEQKSTMMRLVDCKGELNMAMLKGILLTEAEESLSHLVQNIQDKYDGEVSQCSAEDLEVLLEAKLELATISQQWHQAAFSAALAFSAIQLLQDAEIFRMEGTHFKEEKDERQCLDSYIKDVRLPHCVTAQDHINIHLWLRCHTTLVTALVAQICGVGDMEENYVSERRSVLKEVILEAEAFGDIETQAEMMVQAAILDLQEKRPMADIKLLLEIFVCGEPIEQQIDDSTMTCLVLPTKNIYLPQMNLLAQVKMRIGHTLAEKVACTPARGDPLQWLGALKHLESALKLCRASATKRIDLEAELLFQIGKVECQITEASNNKSSRAVESLMEAIKLSQQHDQKFELIRRSYLEIALLYLHFATNNEDMSQTDKMVPSKSNTSSGELSSPGESPKSERYKVQAWIAVRAATQVSEAVLDSQLLIGMKSVKEHSMKDAVQQKIPEFASMDLLASYRDFLSDGYSVVSESPKAFSTETEQIIEDQQRQSEGTESLATKARQKKETITWIHLIRYHNYLKRLYNTNLLFAAPDSRPGSFSARDGHLSSVFDTGIVLRIAEMHSFLKEHLVHYSVCCLENFPEELRDVELPLDRPADSSKVSLEIIGTTSKMSRVGTASPVSVIAEAECQMERRAANASKKEINIQWYIPSLAKPSNDTETKIHDDFKTFTLLSCGELVLLLYAYNTEPVKISDVKNFSSMSVFSGYLCIPLSRIICLRRELSNLKQQIEVLMQSSKSSASEPTCFLEQSETLDITPSKPLETNFAKVHLDEKTE